MNDLSMLSTFAFNAEKLGIVGVLVLFVIYFIYQNHTINKNIVKAVESLDNQTKELKAIFHQQSDFYNKFLNDLRADMKELKDKTSEIHLHCKEQASYRKDYYNKG
ncbi:hypothetical protein [Campylobacter hyointestinalis]|uniref:hypothetical protein n=1 Tax=Campylobacter hyointestinalis TaxID=198 RepID=UPI000DCAF3C9|nr:hypothetical protein [Campylobacter hyointestinalis]RAZ38053.1 hypothetical protein CHL9426_07210 [Campylobacter hyointestinalis subsp. lawsonii]RAZ49219.1 hypothetical protein CHL9004_08010 [Campylobacter hyointestinalis subsp. lawsonii]RAZ54642.1 hypothetical protein CHL10074_06630 [Campylobacter hyointestinalis subsp. lawsonii]RAZ60063.1 hypothetical protein CHL10071_07885 [Campylobacter hyointestinalis subsp. lawsonii]RAZ63374.1 hypothetical protein CHL9767_06995 [Campylobacter hyointes